MPRKAKRFALKKSDIIVLEEIVSESVFDENVKKRAQVLLLLNSGREVNDVAKELNYHVRMVRQSRDRFLELGFEGLLDKPRPGRGGESTFENHDKILNCYQSMQVSGEQPSAAEISEKLGIKEDVVYRLLRTEGLTGPRPQQWIVGYSESPVAKNTDMVGLYLSSDICIFVLQSQRKPIPYSGGLIKTRSKHCYDHVTNLVNTNQVITLPRLVSVAQNYAFEPGATQRNIRSQEFIDDLLKKIPIDTDCEYTFFVFSNGKDDFTISTIGSHIAIKRKETQEEWIKSAAFAYSFLRSDETQANSEQEFQTAITNYLESRSGNYDPFLWFKRPSDYEISDETAPDSPESHAGAPDNGGEPITFETNCILRKGN